MREFVPKPTREKGILKSPQAFQNPELKIIIPLNMRKANAERIQIVLSPNKNSRPAGCRAGEESFLRLFRKQRGGQVAVAGIGQQNNDVLACVLRALCQLDGGPHGGAGGDAHQHAFLVTD